MKSSADNLAEVAMMVAFGALVALVMSVIWYVGLVRLGVNIERIESLFIWWVTVVATVGVLAMAVAVAVERRDDYTVPMKQMRACISRVVGAIVPPADVACIHEAIGRPRSVPEGRIMKLRITPHRFVGIVALCALVLMPYVTAHVDAAALRGLIEGRATAASVVEDAIYSGLATIACNVILGAIVFWALALQHESRKAEK